MSRERNWSELGFFAGGATLTRAIANVDFQLEANLSSRNGRWNSLISGFSRTVRRRVAQRRMCAAYVRRLAALAYLSLRLIEAIAEGRAPADLTATKLLAGMPLSWAEQEQRLPSA